MCVREREGGREGGREGERERERAKVRANPRLLTGHYAQSGNWGLGLSSQVMSTTPYIVRLSRKVDLASAARSLGLARSSASPGSRNPQTPQQVHCIVGILVQT